MRAQILKAVGKPVIFGDRHGSLQERVVIFSSIPYWDVVDLIWFPDEPEHEWLRIGYYKVVEDELIWADRSAIIEPISIWRQILLQTANKNRGSVNYWRVWWMN